MTETSFHFLYPLWLLGLPLPLILWLWPVHYDFSRQKSQIKAYADAHLLPFVSKPCHHYASQRGQLLSWGLLWILGLLAMAGPRWDYQTITLQQTPVEAFILFDISRSMSVNDGVDRVVLARQEAHDLLTQADHLMRVGLIAFASVSQLISPLTDDFATLKQSILLLSPNLVSQQGSRLSSALTRFQQLVTSPKPNLALILITDGDFAEDGQLETQIQQLRNRGIRLYVLGIGSPEGGVVPGLDNGQLSYYGLGQIVSRLDEARLKRFAEIGGGIYQRAIYSEADVKAIVSQILHDTQPADKNTNHTIEIWHERFYWLVGLMALLVLPWFRREGGL